MNNTETLEVTTPSEREIAMTRVFDAPASLVFDAWTKPELVKRWLGLLPGWSFEVCEIDLRVDGAYRFVWSGPESAVLGLGGLYREIVRPERLVCTEKFDEPWYEGEAINTLDFIDEGGRTRLVCTVLAASQEVRDSVLQSGMTGGVEFSYNLLAELLATLASGEKP